MGVAQFWNTVHWTALLVCSAVDLHWTSLLSKHTQNSLLLCIIVEEGYASKSMCVLGINMIFLVSHPVLVQLHWSLLNDWTGIFQLILHVTFKRLLAQWTSESSDNASCFSKLWMNL